MGVDQRVQAVSGLAQGAIVAVGALVIVQHVPGIENGNHGEALALLYAGENGADAHGNAVIVADGFHGGLGGVAGGHGSGQHQYVLAHDHGGGIIPEQQLAAAGMLGRRHVDGAVGVHVHKAGLGELAGHAGADHLRAVQAQDGIDDGGGLKGRRQLHRGLPGLGQAVLGHGQDDIIIDVAVAGGKMPAGDAQGQVGIGGGVLYQLNSHGITLLFSSLFFSLCID